MDSKHMFSCMNSSFLRECVWNFYLIGTLQKNLQQHVEIEPFWYVSSLDHLL
jgi:hypothetical protein